MIMSDEAHAQQIRAAVRSLNVMAEAAGVDGVEVAFDVVPVDVGSMVNPDARVLQQLQVQVRRPL